jgi:hypothetical protein
VNDSNESPPVSTSLCETTAVKIKTRPRERRRFALAKLTFNRIANLGIGLGLPVNLSLSTDLRSPQGWPTEANTASLAPITIGPGAIDHVGMDRFRIIAIPDSIANMGSRGSAPPSRCRLYPAVQGFCPIGQLSWLYHLGSPLNTQTYKPLSLFQEALRMWRPNPTSEPPPAGHCWMRGPSTWPSLAPPTVASRWPDRNPAIYPCSATVVITKNDGGIISS